MAAVPVSPVCPGSAPVIRRLRDRWMVVPGEWWFMHCSCRPLARLLRSERRRLNAETAEWLSEASERLTHRMQERVANDTTGGTDGW